MLILKSFIHKKTTKIYICLLSILFLILLLISSFRSYYSQLLQLEYDINNIYCLLFFILLFNLIFILIVFFYIL